jgi:hypothetical protein
MIIVADPEERVSPLPEGFAPFCSKYAGVELIPDIQVAKPSKFNSQPVPGRRRPD